MRAMAIDTTAAAWRGSAGDQALSSRLSALNWNLYDTFVVSFASGMIQIA